LPRPAFCYHCFFGYGKLQAKTLAIGYITNAAFKSLLATGAKFLFMLLHSAGFGIADICLPGGWGF